LPPRRSCHLAYGLVLPGCCRDDQDISSHAVSLSQLTRHGVVIDERRSPGGSPDGLFSKEGVFSRNGEGHAGLFASLSTSRRLELPVGRDADARGPGVPSGDHARDTRWLRRRQVVELTRIARQIVELQRIRVFVSHDQLEVAVDPRTVGLVLETELTT